jgi:hypothetical protein
MCLSSQIWKFGDSDNVNTINEVINLELNSAMNTYIPKKIIRVTLIKTNKQADNHPDGYG